MCRQCSHPHPVVYLRGVLPEDLASLLDFMYHGQASVAEAEVRPEHEQLQINELPSGLIILLGKTVRSPKFEATVVEAQQFATEMLQNRS